MNNSGQFRKVIHPTTSADVKLSDSGGADTPNDMYPSILNDVVASYFSMRASSSYPVLQVCNWLPMFPVIVDCEGVGNVIENLKVSALPRASIILM